MTSLLCTPLSRLCESELHMVTPNIQGIKYISFEYANQVIQDIDESYPYEMLGWLTIILCILDTLVLKIICSFV